MDGYEGDSMNKELRELAIRAGAPEQVLDEFWFNIFCLQFASVLLDEAEQEMTRKTKVDA